MPFLLSSLPCRLSRYAVLTTVLCGMVCAATPAAYAQATSFDNGYSAAAEARGGTLAAQQGSPIDAVEGNPAGLAGIKTRTLEVSGIGVFGSGSFQNSVNTNGRMS
jgi:long-subunit fatty acid transport protein